MTDIEQIWEAPIRSVARFSDSLIFFSFFDRFPRRVQRVVSVAFWGYHWLVTALFALERPLGAINPGSAMSTAQPLIAFWGIYAAILVCIWLPFNALHSLYRYLRTKDLLPSHSIIIAALALVGAIAILFLYRFSA